MKRSVSFSAFFNCSSWLMVLENFGQKRKSVSASPAHFSMTSVGCRLYHMAFSSMELNCRTYCDRKSFSFVFLGYTDPTHSVILQRVAPTYNLRSGFGSFSR